MTMQDQPLSQAVELTPLDERFRADPDPVLHRLRTVAPVHRRLRGPVRASFTPAPVERWRPRIRAVVQRVLERIDTFEFDPIESFAGPVRTVVIAEMLRAGQDGDRLTDVEMIRQCNLLLVAGNVTTCDLIGTSFRVRTGPR